MFCSSTLEYQLMIDNVKCKELITNSVKNKDEILNLIDSYIEAEATDLDAFMGLLKVNTTNNELNQIYKNHKFEKKDFMKHTIATRYLESISKGTVAQELATKIMMINLENDTSEKEASEDTIILNVPNYIKEAIQWIHQ